VVDQLTAPEVKTKAAVEMLSRLGVTGKVILIDLALDEKLEKSVRNLEGVAFVPSSRVTARDIVNAQRVVATRGAIEKLQEVLA
jgi:large subunit ribosomal protein L4